MKFIIIFLSVLSCFTACAFAESEHYLKKDQIIITETGFFFVLDDFVVAASTVNYVGNGIYCAEYYGQCERCGWALEKSGKCTNQNCNRNGPRERD